MLEFDADLLQFAAVWRRMNRAYLSPNRRRLGLYVQAHDLQRDPGSDDIVVAGRITAAVRIHARGKEESLIGLRSGRRTSPCAVFLLLFWQARWFPSLPGDKRRTAPPSAPAG